MVLFKIASSKDRKFRILSMMAGTKDRKICVELFPSFQDLFQFLKSDHYQGSYDHFCAQAFSGGHYMVDGVVQKIATARGPANLAIFSTSQKLIAPQYLAIW